MKPGSFLATAESEAAIRLCPRVAALLPDIAASLAGQTAGAPGRLFDITDFAAAETHLIGEVLGEGEVAATVALPDGIVAQVQESVLAGLWRVRFQGADGCLAADYLEVGAVPEAVRRGALLTAPALALASPPAGAMNVMPLLAEIGDRMARWRKGDDAHVINFSLLPMTPEDMAFLQATLGRGPVAFVSRGYGACRVVATGARHVWSVQYLNAMDTIILDTLEIVDVPAAVLAADEDFHDSAVRLREIEEAYFR
jgi:hydrogenase-1 operon protein HyaF